MKKYFIGLIIFSLILPINIVKAADLAEQLKGKILLQVEENGEAWYVNPEDSKRYFLGRPDDAFNLMRDFGIGITNENLKKIPIGFTEAVGADTDGDSLSDLLEDAIGTDKTKADTDNDGFNDKDELLNGYNPINNNDLKYDLIFSAKQKGKIFLQIENNGEAWYVNPEDSKRYFLGRPDDAFNLMRSLGLGISNENLEKIKANTVAFTGTQIEKKIFEGINEQRLENGRAALTWNDELASVAREHSENLAKENEAFTGMGMSCAYPMIHHEGLDFGIYNSERLQAREVYYYSAAGENIALVPIVLTQVLFKAGDSRQIAFNACPDKRDLIEDTFKSELETEEDEDKKVERIREEIEIRVNEFSKEVLLDVVEQTWYEEDTVVEDIVVGWMNSPGHRENILEEKYDETGIGTATVNGYIIATQVFIKRADCGFKTGPCCREKGYQPYCFIPLECSDLVCE